MRANGGTRRGLLWLAGFILLGGCGRAAAASDQVSTESYLDRLTLNQLEERAEQTFSVGLYELSAEATARALAIAEQQSGENSQQAAKFAGNLGALYNLLGREKEAEQLLNRARRIRGSSGVPLGLQTEAFFERARKGGLPTRWPTPAERLDQLTHQLKDANPYIRKEAVVKLGTLITIDGLHLNPDPALQALGHLLVDDDEQVRQSAANALSQSNPEAALTALMAVAHNADSAIRRTAMVSLGTIASRSKGKVSHTVNPNTASEPTGHNVVKVLTEAVVADQVGSVRSAAAWALMKMGRDAQEATPHLIQALQDADRDVQLHAQEALKRMRTPEALEALRAVEPRATSQASTQLPQEGEQPEWLVAERKWKAFEDEYLERFFKHEAGGYWFQERPIDRAFIELKSRLIAEYLPAYRVYTDRSFTFILAQEGQIICIGTTWPLKEPYQSAPDFKTESYSDFIRRHQLQVDDPDDAIRMVHLKEIIDGGHGYVDDEELRKRQEHAQYWAKRTGNEWTVSYRYINLDPRTQVMMPSSWTLVVDDQNRLQQIKASYEHE